METFEHPRRESSSKMAGREDPSKRRREDREGLSVAHARSVRLFRRKVQARTIDRAEPEGMPGIRRQNKSTATVGHDRTGGCEGM